ncbi:hypothetical protein MRX96_042848 [Rhipicephalus microplus]
MVFKRRSYVRLKYLAQTFLHMFCDILVDWKNLAPFLDISKESLKEKENEEEQDFKDVNSPLHTVVLDEGSIQCPGAYGDVSSPDPFPAAGPSGDSSQRTWRAGCLAVYTLCHLAKSLGVHLSKGCC